MTGERGETSRRSLFTLIGNLPTLLIDLVRNELESLKNEIAGKLKSAGIGIGLLAGAVFIALFALMVLIAAAVLGLATVLPAWAAALIVGGIILVIAVILALAGIGALKKGVPPAPTDTIKSIKKDVRTIKGTERNVTS
ncbi:phage holin family protein [Salinibacterium sp.]|uniref:phage holin family protein n=1 Tax=Salinibacterium sp. TaxID=1915057 RepID=UPI00286C461D|nr:phage holin family protein [Salinibacterium sp.]